MAAGKVARNQGLGYGIGLALWQSRRRWLFYEEERTHEARAGAGRPIHLEFGITGRRYLCGDLLWSLVRAGSRAAEALSERHGGAGAQPYRDAERRCRERRQ